MNEEILIPIAFFITAFGILYVIFSTRNKERLALIEKGADASLFQSKRNNKHHSLKAGMFLAGIGLGILLGNILDVTTQLKEEVAYFSMIFLCGGFSLIFFYLYAKKVSSGSQE